jgi:hypothetical protein
MRGSFTYGKGTITAREPLVRDELAISGLIAQLGTRDSATDDFWERSVYARFLRLATVEGDVGFDVPVPNASRKELRAGYETFLSQKGPLITNWQTALGEVTTSPEAEKNEVGAGDDDEPDS